MKTKYALRVGADGQLFHRFEAWTDYAAGLVAVSKNWRLTGFDTEEDGTRVVVVERMD